MNRPEAAQVNGCAVRVIMPIRDAERHLRETVAVVLGQDSRITCVPNPTGRTLDALSAAIAASHHEVLVRVDGHAVIQPSYQSAAVNVLRRTGVDSVGGHH